MKKCLLSTAVAVTTLFSACLLAAHSSGQTATTWNGGTADWENAAFWNNGVPNSASADAFIDGGKTGITSVVTMENSKTVGRLTLDAGDTLNLGNNNSFTIQGGAFGGSGVIINNGEIDFPNNGDSDNIIFLGNTTISGTGTINLFAAGSVFGQSIYSPNGVGDRLTIGAGQTITGSTSSNNGGSLGGGQSTFTNNGTINANTSLDALVIAPGGGNGNDFTNGPTGLAEASNGGNLVLSGGNFNNGSFQALDGSNVSINTGAISGATLTTMGSGTVTVDNNVTLTSVINSGTLNLNNKSVTIAGGTLTNTGTISLLAAGGGTGIFFSGNTSISGSGTINLFAAGTPFGQSIRSANGNGERLTIGAGQTITGSTLSNNGGSLGGGNSTITNNGTVNANTNLDTFVIQPGGGNGNDFTNSATGLVEATNGGTLTNNFAGVFNNNGTFAVVSEASGGSSTFSLSAASLTNFSGTTLTGGTYHLVSSDSTNTSTLSFGGGTIATNAANVTLDGANTIFAEINGLATNQGSFMIANGRDFTTAGALANSGTLVAASGSTLGTNDSLTQNGTLLISPKGAVSVNSGDYTQGSAAIFNLELGEDNPAGFQQITVSGTAHLAGTLQVALVNGYMPAPNQTFTIIKAAAVDGQFDSVTGATVTYTATEVIIHPTQNTATLTLTGAVSRKTHGSAGDFDLPLILAPAGSGTVEPRAGGPTTIVFTFSDNVAAADGTLDANEFTITNASFSSASISGNTLTLDLNNVVDQSVVSVTLNGIVDTNGSSLSGDNDVEVRALAGDANQDQIVDGNDFTAVKAHAGQPLNQMSGNFLFDLNVNGVIARPDGHVVRVNRAHTVQ